MSSSRAGREYARHKRRAWRGVEAALAATAQPCEVCGATPAQAHHWDYEQPLSVHWLCQKHHSAAHSPKIAGPGMSKSGKTDNAKLGPKLSLRRHFMSRYHVGAGSQSPIVFDACQGAGVLWSILRQEFGLEGYLGVDKKPKKGRLVVDSARYLERSGWPFTVVDIDTYGSPWAHWSAVLRNAPGPVTVFLTIGKAGGLAGIDTFAAEAMGLGPLFEHVPRFMGAALEPLAVDACLARCLDHGWTVVECAEAKKGPNARYIGVRLER